MVVRMTRITGLALALLLLGPGSLACADEKDWLTTRFGTDRNQWQTVNARMTPEEYRQKYKKNRSVARRVLTNYSKDTLLSLGVPETGIKLMGTAIALATRTTRFHIDKNKLMALEFKNATEDNRTLFFKFSIDW